MKQAIHDQIPYLKVSYNAIKAITVKKQLLICIIVNLLEGY